MSCPSDVQTLKECNQCGQLLPLECFYTYRNRHGTQSPRSYCKGCFAQKQAERRGNTWSSGKKAGARPKAEWEAMVRDCLEAPPSVSSRILADKWNSTKETINKIRAGSVAKGLFPELPRTSLPTAQLVDAGNRAVRRMPSCRDCRLWDTGDGGRCSLGMQDPKRVDVTALSCPVYWPNDVGLEYVADAA